MNMTIISLSEVKNVYFMSGKPNIHSNYLRDFSSTMTEGLEIADNFKGDLSFIVYSSL